MDYLERVKKVHSVGDYGSKGYAVLSLVYIDVYYGYLSDRYDPWYALLLCQLLMFCCYYSYQYDWKYDEAAKNILRTHTTAISARMLYQLAREVGLV